MSQRIRLTYFSDTRVMGGAEEYLHLLIEKLDRRRYDIRFVCTNEEAMAPLIEQLRPLHVSVTVLREATTGEVERPELGNLFSLWRLFRRHPADILHFNLPHPYACRTAIIAAKLARAAVIVATNHLPTIGPDQYTWKGKLVLRLAQRCLDLTIVESDINRQTALSNYNLDPVRTAVVYHGIDVNKFDRSFDRQLTLKELGLSPADTIIGTVGRLTPQKAQHIFLAAAARVKKDCQPAKFVIAGEGEMRRQLQQQAQQLGLSGDVIFAGYRADMARLLSVFDVFVLSSIFEGLPLSILEAMALSKPIVATRVDGVPEAVLDGETGLLVPPHDSAALAHAMLSLLRNPSRARSLGQAARRRVETVFRQETMAAQTEQLYMQLLQRRSASQCRARRPVG